mgnify:FL=1
MEIITSLDNRDLINASVLTIGSYDGLHKGHQKILKSVVEFSRLHKIPSVLVTFHPHPSQIIKTENSTKKRLIMNFESKMSLVEKLGLDYACIITFNQKFSKVSAESFLDDYIIPFFNPQKIFIGFDHHFGNKRKGNPEFLKRYCLKNNIELTIKKPVLNDNIKISSTIIRSFIKNGEINKANNFLGSTFSFNSKVVRGSGRGSELGFPTANILPTENNQLLPKSGVYFVKAMINGQYTFGMCNLGTRPTFSEIEFVIEVHFFDNSIESLYGEILKVEFLEWIREEVKFADVNDLVVQLSIDKQLCLGFQGKYE